MEELAKNPQDIPRGLDDFCLLFVKFYAYNQAKPSKTMVLLKMESSLDVRRSEA